MATEIPAHADTSTKEGKQWWERWAAVGDAKEVANHHRATVAALKQRWGACRRLGLTNGQSCACGQCEARVLDALEALGHAVEKYDAAVAEFKGN